MFRIPLMQSFKKKHSLYHSKWKWSVDVEDLFSGSPLQPLPPSASSGSVCCTFASVILVFVRHSGGGGGYLITFFNEMTSWNPYFNSFLFSLHLSKNRLQRQKKCQSTRLERQTQDKEMHNTNKRTWRSGGMERNWGRAGWVGVMHAGQEARGKISDRHYGDTELPLTHLNHFVTWHSEMCWRIKASDDMSVWEWSGFVCSAACWCCSKAVDSRPVNTAP